MLLIRERLRPSSDDLADENPYRASRDLEIGIAERGWKQADSWRRAFFASALIVVVEASAIVILAGKTQHDVLVYARDDQGLHYQMQALSSRTPTRTDIEAQLVHWVRALRDIPGGGDYAAVDRNVHDVLMSTAKDSQADADVRRFLTDQNPKVLSARISRTVQDAHASAVTDHTYELSWTEVTRMGARTIAHALSGTLTIAPPQIPDDAAVAAVNPAGVYVTSFDLHFGGTP